jgi:hypothetical protein
MEEAYDPRGPGRDVKRVGLIALLFLTAAMTAAAASAVRQSAEDPSASRCGGQLWRLKTLSDVARMSVRLKPESTTIAAISEQASPRTLPTRRRTNFQRQAWEVVAQVTAYRLETEGIRLVLFDGGSYLNAVIPAPSCLSPVTRARNAITAAWKRFATDCARPTREWQTFGAIVYIRGVGFWSQRRTLRGSATNGAELHPVTGFRVVAGCS